MEALAPALAPPAQLGLPPPGPAEAGSCSLPLVYLAAGRDEVGLWDVATGRCRQVGFRFVEELVCHASTRAQLRPSSGVLCRCQ